MRTRECQCPDFLALRGSTVELHGEISDNPKTLKSRMLGHFNIYLLSIQHDPTLLPFMPAGGQYVCTEDFACVLVFGMPHDVRLWGTVPGTRTSA